MNKELFKLFFAALIVTFLAGCNSTEDTANQEANDQQPTNQEQTNQQPNDQEAINRHPANEDPTNQQSATQEPANQEAASPQSFDLPTGETAEAQEAFNSNMTPSTVEYTMFDFLNYVLNDVHNFWAGIMMQAGYPEPFVNYKFPTYGESVPSRCKETGFTSELEFFYCPVDDQIIFTQPLAIRLWEGTYEVNDDVNVPYNAGDFSVAVLMAHEYAHSLQGELGWFPNGQLLVPAKRTEQNADCLAGVWANSVYSRGLLETGDIEEVMRTLSDLGDDTMSLDQDHGSPAERTEAFVTGYESGSASSCDHYLYNDY